MGIGWQVLSKPGPITSNGTKSHIIPLNNHLNIRRTMLSLMASSASCDRKHDIAMLMPESVYMSNVTYLPYAN